MDESGRAQVKHAQINSSPYSTSNSKFDVFMNHQGPDTKNTIVSTLERALCQVACNPFMDVKSLVKGEGAFSSITDALMRASVHIAIFSPRYAESKYCLNELCEMLSSKKTIIPIFYNIQPENLCQIEIGPFADAFHKHNDKKRIEDVKRWKIALLDAASISGFIHDKHVNDMAELVDKVVHSVLKALPSPPPLPVARHPVGMSESSSDVCNMLNAITEHVGIVGICGMGGIGKTTLANEVYNQKRVEFKNHCFLKNLKDDQNSTVNLQMRLVAELFHMEVKKLPNNHEQRFKMIQEQKVFIVFDDISGIEQFRDLIPDLKTLSPGSRVILTSRDSAILRDIMSDLLESQQRLYNVPELNMSDSLELFIWCAFKKTSLNDVGGFFQRHVEEVTRACCGVPLALETMGGYLRDRRGLEYWDEAISTLKSNEVVMGSLQISYKGLGNDDERRMFVDIACLMLGHPKQICLTVWEANGYDAPNSSLSNLVDKCLVKVDEEGVVCMHDLVRDMGRRIVKELSRAKKEAPSHVWSALEGERLLKMRKESNNLVALSLIGMESSKALNAQALTKMSNLTYLLLDTCLVEGDFSMWSEELRWLQWRYYGHAQLPSSLKLPNLAVLDLANSYQLRELWSKEIECPFEELKILQLQYCTNLMEIPTNIIDWIRLKQVDICACTNLVELPESFGSLCSLEILIMSHCVKFEKLPTSFFNLSKLSILHLDYSALMEVPKDFGKLSSLLEVSFGGCTNLVELPESFGSLCKLENLYMWNCVKFEKLPTSFLKLIKLSILHLVCTPLLELPKDFGQLSSLKEVSFCGCKNLVELPESFGSLCNLDHLDMGYCEKFERLPTSFPKLIKLSNLFLNSTALMELPKDFGQLSSLKEVSFDECTELVELPDSFGSLCNLEILQMQNCVKFERLSTSFLKLIKLSKLHLDSTALMELPKDFGKLASLKEVSFCGCKNLVELPDSFGSLCNLEILQMQNCVKFERLSTSFLKLIKLSKLHLDSTALMELPKDFGKLASLKEVSFCGCKNLVELPDSFGSLCNLEHLDMRYCEKFERLPTSFPKLIKLSNLFLNSTALMELPKDFGQLASLKKVSFCGCKNLVELPESFGSLCNLEFLDMRHCKKLERLPSSFPKLVKLSRLHVDSTALLELPKDFGHLSSLKEDSEFWWM